MAISLNVQTEIPRFKAMIGTGGLGSGSIFLLNGNETLGREESRGGRFLDARDYCKLHIISHYVKGLTGPDFHVVPIGKLGNDNVGTDIHAQMEKAGLEMTYVRVSPDDSTLFSFCFLYPDGSGGNLTTENSASTKVDPSFIAAASRVFSEYKGQFIALAAPEVPLAARKKLLELSREHDGFNVASFTSAEMNIAKEQNFLPLVDLLAINIDEAAAFCNASGSPDDKAERIIEETIERMNSHNPSMCISITAGKHGSWAWDGNALSFVPVFPVSFISSAGAGDAHVAGVISGLAAGLSLRQAQTVGNLAAAYSVTSQHTIHPDLSKSELLKMASQSQNRIEPEVLKLLSH